ncbi:hypothetical protein KSP40_PGU022355 [Platanthera guangdongensis]|uniref:DUF7912 domain-containing protein n=1 Tax=Platanthera guangdongensis TaxID=2320717 RepID=A0ABR2M276_9ASPA
MKGELSHSVLRTSGTNNLLPRHWALFIEFFLCRGFAKTITKFLPVSSPGIERVVAVPKDLERFKDRPMYVKYTTMDAETSTIQEADGVFCLISFDLENSHCLWGIADVKINRQKAGKGRSLSKKQRQWRLQTSFESLRELFKGEVEEVKEIIVCRREAEVEDVGLINHLRLQWEGYADMVTGGGRWVEYVGEANWRESHIKRLW